MGLEAGWNCHISLLGSNSTTTGRHSIDPSQGYASVNGSTDFLPVFGHQLDLPPLDLTSHARRLLRFASMHSHSAPDVIAVQNALSENPRTSRKSEQDSLQPRRPTGLFHSPPSSTAAWENPEEDPSGEQNVSSHAPLLLQHAAGRAAAYAVSVEGMCVYHFASCHLDLIIICLIWLAGKITFKYKTL